jgi:hypothetical protein
MMAAYAEGVRVNGRTHLYRQALINAPGHCTFTAPEAAALVDAMIRRIQTGQWDDTTSPEELNAVGRSLRLEEPRFMPTEGLATKSNRAFFPAHHDQVDGVEKW